MTNLDWAENFALHRRLTRDVCFLYEDLSGYRHIMGDIDYATEFDLPYWDIINEIDTQTPQDRFLRGGLLVLMLAMTEDVFLGSGSYVTAHLEAVENAVARFIPEDHDILRLSEALGHAVGLLQSESPRDDHLSGELCWAYDAFVGAYFRERARR